jgi:hypothetical protein
MNSLFRTIGRYFDNEDGCTTFVPSRHNQALKALETTCKTWSFHGFMKLFAADLERTEAAHGNARDVERRMACGADSPGTTRGKRARRHSASYIIAWHVGQQPHQRPFVQNTNIGSASCRRVTSTTTHYKSPPLSPTSRIARGHRARLRSPDYRTRPRFSHVASGLTFQPSPINTARLPTTARQP